MVLTKVEKAEIVKILDFRGTDEQLLEIVNEMIIVYYKKISDYKSVEEFIEDFEKGNVNIITITKSISNSIKQQQTYVDTNEQNNNQIKLDDQKHESDSYNVDSEANTNIIKEKKKSKKLVLKNNNNKEIKLNQNKAYYISILLIPIILSFPVFFQIIELSNIMLITLLLLCVVNILSIFKHQFNTIFKATFIIIAVNWIGFKIINYVLAQYIRTIWFNQIHVETLLLLLVVILVYVININLVVKLIKNLPTYIVKKNLAKGFKPEIDDQNIIIIDRAQYIKLPWWV